MRASPNASPTPNLPLTLTGGLTLALALTLTLTLTRCVLYMMLLPRRTLRRQLWPTLLRLGRRAFVAVQLPLPLNLTLTLTRTLTQAGPRAAQP